jgi:hypothetical protein
MSQKLLIFVVELTQFFSIKMITLIKLQAKAEKKKQYYLMTVHSAESYIVIPYPPY